MTAQSPKASPGWPRLAHEHVIWAASACAVMSGAAIAPAIPAIERAFGAGEAGVWGRIALVLPALIVMFAGPMVGRWTGHLHQGRGFVVALLALGLSGVFGGLAGGFAGLMVTRVALGVATAATLCFATAAIATLFSGARRGFVIGRQSAINTFAGVVFVLLGGLLAQWGWRMPFLLYLLALPVAWFAAQQTWGERPQICHQRVETSAFRAPLLTIGFAMAGFYLVPVQAPFVSAVAATPALAGVTIGCATLTSGIASLMIVSQPEHARRLIVVFANVILALGLIEMALAQTLVAVLLAAALIGIGFGAVLPVAIRHIMAQTTAATANAVSGLVASALYAGQGSALVVALIAGRWGAQVPFAGMAALLMIATFLYLYGPRLRRWGRRVWDQLA